MNTTCDSPAELEEMLDIDGSSKRRSIKYRIICDQPLMLDYVFASTPEEAYMKAYDLLDIDPRVEIHIARVIESSGMTGKMIA